MEGSQTSEGDIPAESQHFMQLQFLRSFLEHLSFNVDLQKRASSPSSPNAKTNPQLADLLTMISPGFVSITKIRTDLQRAPYISYTSPTGKTGWSPSQLFKAKELGTISEELYFGRYDALISSAQTYSGPELATFLQASFHQSGILDLAQSIFSWLMNKSLPQEGAFAKIDSTLNTPVYRYFTFSPDSIVLRDVLAYSQVSVSDNPEEATRTNVAIDFFLESEVRMTFNRTTNQIDIAIANMQILFPSQSDMDIFNSLTAVSFPETLISGIQFLLSFAIKYDHDLSKFHSLVQRSYAPLSEEFLQSIAGVSEEKMALICLPPPKEGDEDFTKVDVVRKNKPSGASV